MLLSSGCSSVPDGKQLDQSMEMSGSGLSQETLKGGRKPVLSSSTSGANGTVFSSKVAPGLQFEMTEEAEDLDEPEAVLLHGTTKVDANSDLVVSFEVPPKTLASGETLGKVKEFLKKTEDLGRRWKEMNDRRIDLNQPSVVKDFQEEVESFGREVVALITIDLSAIVDDAELTKVLMGKQRPQGSPREPYANLAWWLSREITRIEKEIADSTQRAKMKVSVTAFLEPKFGKRKPISIPGYDHLPIGELQPIDRNGLNLTEAEKKRLDQEIELSTAVAASIKEIQKNGQEIERSFKSRLSELDDLFREVVRDLQNTLKKVPATWLATLKQFLIEAKKSPTNLMLNDSENKEIEKLMGHLNAFQRDVNQLTNVLDEFRQLENLVRQSKNSPLRVALMDQGELFEKLNGAVSNIGVLVKTGKSWIDRVEDTGESLEVLETSFQDRLKKVGITEGEKKRIKEVLAKLLTDALRTNLVEGKAKFTFKFEGIFDELSEESLKETRVAMEMIKGVLEKSQSLAKGSESLGGTEQVYIERPIDNLVPARIELQRSGLALGDNVTVNVKVKEDRPGVDSETTVPEHSYKTKAVLFGVHRRIGGDLIFARGFGSSEARDWKPNVAARAEWHYQERNPGKPGKIWNFLDPGIGLHLASLDQGSDSVELGMGANISLFQSFINGGYGFNMSTEQMYVYVGLNLLEVLNQAQGAIRK